MTWADLLDMMEVADSELDTGAAEKDEARSLTALRMAGQMFDVRASRFPKVLGKSVNVTTTVDVETSAWPTTLMRLDGKPQFIDPGTNLPVFDVEPLREVGGHVPSLPWPLQVVLTSGTGKPRAFWTDKTNIYWLPLPDATHTVRFYGYIRQITATPVRGGTYLFPDDVSVPMAVMATKLLRIGRDDPIEALEALAAEAYDDVLHELKKFERGYPQGRSYSVAHTT